MTPHKRITQCSLHLLLYWLLKEGQTHLVCEIEVRVHLDHLPAAITILINSYEQAGVILLPPLDVKVRCLRVAWNHIPIQRPTITIQTYKYKKDKLLLFSNTELLQLRHILRMSDVNVSLSLFHSFSVGLWAELLHQLNCCISNFYWSSAGEQGVCGEWRTHAQISDWIRDNIFSNKICYSERPNLIFSIMQHVSV